MLRGLRGRGSGHLWDTAFHVISRRAGIALIAVAAALAVVGAAYMATRRDPATPTKPVPPVDSRDLKDTLVVATDRAPVPDGKNVLWCASFQLAWDAFRRDLLGGAPLVLGPPAPADEVAALNADTFPPGGIDPSSFVAIAGRDGIGRRFQDAATAKFGDDASGLDLPAVPPGDLAAFAMLLKNLPFEHPFENFKAGLRFAGSTKTAGAFGMNQASDNPDLKAILEQVRVHADSTEGNGRTFVIELSVRGGHDRLLLARIDPAPTLRGTWERARDAAHGPGEAAERGTVLGIPKLNLDVAHRFEELEGGSEGLDAAFQRTRFRLDETGARLTSFAYAIQRGGMSPVFLFDRPFLVALVQKGATRPYLLLWIGNDELLTAP